MGGIGIFAGVIFGIFFSLLFQTYIHFNISLEYAGILIGALLMLLTGILDDTKGLSAQQKFIAQLLAASIVIIFGCRLETIINPFGTPIQLGIFSIPVTFLWLIWVTNAINLLDGLDGLAGGVSIIVLTVFLIFSIMQSDYFSMILCISLIAGTLGFLRYNFHPAKIFMGDTGALFIGFMIASISLKGLQKSNGNVALLVPLVALALPLIDSALAFIRRLNKGHHPFHADKDHLHHRLIFLGLSQKQAVSIIYVVCILFGITAYIIAIDNMIYGTTLLIFVILIAVLSLIRLGYLEAQKRKTYLGDNSVIRVSRDRAPLLMRRLLHKFILYATDLLSLNVALGITYWFRFYSGIYESAPIVTPEFYLGSAAFILLSFYFMLLFTLNGMYNLSWDISRFDLILRLFKVIFFGTLILYVITLDPENIFSPSRLTIVFYTVVLFLCVTIGRLTVIFIEKHFSMLEYAPHNTILVGTGRNAKKIVRDIRKNPHLLYNIIGVVSKDKPAKEFENLKYLGKYDNISNLIRKYKIQEIIIAINERSRDEILQIVAYGENMQVSFKIVPQMYDVISGHKTKSMIDHPLIKLFPDQMQPWQWLLKRASDILGAIISIILLLPLFLIIFIAQMINGIFPFFKIENKVGKQGKIFGQLLLNINDRKSALGIFLYKTYLYKMPQLINVMLGSMSLVGPRPEPEERIKDLRRRIKFFNRRFLVRPGITGWTQVRFRYSESLKQLKEQFKQDMYYLENMSLLFDLQIIIRSLFLLFFRRS
jgi:UDP-GlcNAc:undecaprenyl-phosphate GlcNAc-1-phosphate transferase